MLILGEVLGFLIEYVLLAVEVALLLLLLLAEELVLVAEETDDGVALVEDEGLLEVMVLSMPTQYAYPPQKLVTQSSETAGFHLRKSAWDILKSVSMV